MNIEIFPIETRRKAMPSGKEYGWKKDDFNEAVLCAQKVGMASLGGQPQFIFPDGIFELYWITYDSQDRNPDESWQAFVDRSAQQVLVAFQKVCNKTDFDKIVLESKFVQECSAKENRNPLDFLWFIGDFVTEKEYKELEKKYTELKLKFPYS